MLCVPLLACPGRRALDRGRGSLDHPPPARRRVRAARGHRHAMQVVSCKQVLDGTVPVESKVELRGWVRTRRDSKAGISFVQISDGSGQDPLQVVAPNTLPNYQQQILRLTAGCSVVCKGTLVRSQGKGQAFEVLADSIAVLGMVDDP